MTQAFYREGRFGRVHLLTLQEAEERFERALFHEAGHAAVALFAGIRVKHVKVDADHAVTTRVRSKHPLDGPEIQRRVAFIAAGYLAERRRIPRDRAWARRCAETDFRDVRRLLARGNHTFGQAGFRLAWRALTQHWPFVVAISNLVRARGEAFENELLSLAVAHGVVPVNGRPPSSTR